LAVLPGGAGPPQRSAGGGCVGPHAGEGAGGAAGEPLSESVGANGRGSGRGGGRGGGPAGRRIAPDRPTARARRRVSGVQVASQPKHGDRPLRSGWTHRSLRMFSQLAPATAPSSHPGTVTFVGIDGTERTESAAQLPDWLKFAPGADGSPVPV